MRSTAGNSPDVDRPHVEGGHFGTGRFGCGEALVHRHAGGAAGRQIDDGVASGLDARQKLPKDARIGGRAPVAGIARVKMQDGRAGLGGRDRFIGDLVRGDRQVRGHAWRVQRAGDRTGDDDRFRHRQASARTRFSIAPSESISTRTRSPSLSQKLLAMPTPAGVPVAIRSPGSKVITVVRYSIWA